MGEGKGERHRAAKAIADQHGIAADFQFIEAVLDAGNIGVHQRQQRRLRTMKARQIKERHAVLRGKRRQHRIEGVAVGEQRMQHDNVGAFAGSHRRQRAVSGR